MPVLAADLVEPRPGLGTELRLIPGADGEGGGAEFRTGYVLGRPQRMHAGEAPPWSGKAGRAAVEDADVGDAFAQEAEGDRKTVLAAADDRHVQHRFAHRSCVASPILAPGSSHSRVRTARVRRDRRGRGIASSSHQLQRVRSVAEDGLRPWRMPRRCQRSPVFEEGSDPVFRSIGHVASKQAAYQSCRPASHGASVRPDEKTVQSLPIFQPAADRTGGRDATHRGRPRASAAARRGRDRARSPRARRRSDHCRRAGARDGGRCGERTG